MSQIHGNTEMWYVYVHKQNRNSIFWFQDRLTGLFYMFCFLKIFFCLWRGKYFLWGDYWDRWFCSQCQMWSLIFERWMLITASGKKITYLAFYRTIWMGQVCEDSFSKGRIYSYLTILGRQSAPFLIVWWFYPRTKCCITYPLHQLLNLSFFFRFLKPSD